MESVNHVGSESVKTQYYRLLNILDAGTPSGASVAHALRVIRQAAMRLSNISERECNGVIGHDGFAKWDDSDQKRADTERTNAEQRISSALDLLFDADTRKRLTIEFQGDPRGPSVIIGVLDGAQRVLTLW